MQERRSNLDRRQETRSALIKAARTLFLEKGYAATGTPEVVECANLTRGALYHHFKDKQALFLAVVEAEAAQIAAEIETGSAEAHTPLMALYDGAQAYFAAMRARGRVRLMLLEGPAVLSPETMRRIDLETGGRELRLGIAEALGGRATGGQVDTLADLVSAVFDRAALAINGGADAQLYEATVRELLAALVNPPVDAR